ncbi:MAG: DUF4156 domain-containing protein [Gammaproteobacteria bacterium]|nr:DUF4156 domain-containing protein [Gammaproteobacteria bacterium]
MLLGFTIICLVMSGCSWVSLSPDGEKTRVLDASEVTSCKKIGLTTATVLSKVAIFSRNSKKMADELATIARNQAAELGGDTIVPASEIADGKRNYDIYRCVGL